MNTSLGWADVETITRGQIGRMVRTPCPICSHTRRKETRQVFRYDAQGTRTSPIYTLRPLR